MQTHYQSSKGPMEIASMPLPYLKNALAKLERDDGPADVIEAMRYRLDNEPEAPADEPNPRAVMGANNPPEPTSYEAIKAHIEDLYAEAKHWLDGAEITSQAEADKVTILLDEMRIAESMADRARVEENRPFDEGKAAVQEKYAPLIGNTKKVRGMTVRAIDGCKAVLGPWRIKQAREAEERAAAARREAEEKANAAALAAREALGDLAAQEVAEVLVSSAQQAVREAAKAEKGATSGTGLTTYYEPVLTDQKVAVLHYMRDQPQRFLDLCMDMAKADVRAGKRAIPGFSVEERKRVV